MGLAKRIDDYCIFVSRENLLVKGKCMKKTWTKVLAYMLAVTMCFSAVNVPVYAQESTVTEVSTEAETTSDAITEKILVSTKSLDIATQSYQKPNTLKNMLNKDGDSLKNIEKNYFDEGILEWGGTTLKTSQYDKKALEIVLPDVIISENALKVLNDFKTSMEKEGIEVWYRIAK